MKFTDQTTPDSRFSTLQCELRFTRAATIDTSCASGRSDVGRRSCLQIGVTAFVAVSLCLLPAFVTAQDSGVKDWDKTTIPDAWRRPPKAVSGERGRWYWYRAQARVPASWKGKTVRIAVEPTDDARAVYINGTQVGGTGVFPPRYRSGLGESHRFEIPAEQIRFGDWNEIAVRTYYLDGRSNFSVAPPALYTDTEGIRMAGSWLIRQGSQIALGQSDLSGKLEPYRYSETQKILDLELFLKRRSGDHDPLTPADSLKRFEVAEGLEVDLVLSEPEIGQPLFVNFDERGRMWVLEYRQYPNPAGLKAISRDQYLRTVFDKVPLPPPHGVKGADRISIHEDTDGDGVLDQHKLFVDGLNIATSFVRGRGGVWVLNPPYLLFYPDANDDDVPDSDPIVHLEGFGLEDTHSVVNSLRWGPDGWLYAAQGSTVSANLIRTGLDKTPQRSMGQLIWRYHPETRTYEVFAEGGGNTFGVEIDDDGTVFSGTNGGDSRGYHYVQGGYARKSFGKHGALSNPYAFGYFPAMKHHKVPRFTHNFVVYGGGALPPEFDGQLFGIEPLQGQVVMSEVSRDGSTFETRDISRPLKTDDQWFRPVDIKVGPDGAIYVCDLHEQRIDHSSHFAGRVATETGRIYRLRAADSRPATQFDYSGHSSTELLKLLKHANRWHRQTAQRLIADRRDRSLIQPILGELDSAHGQYAVELLWALNSSGGLSDAAALKLLFHDEPHVRRWVTRLVCDDHRVAAGLADALVKLATAESYVDVRSQLASSARRLPAEQGLAIVSALLLHDEDASDPHVPLLLWWAVEKQTSGETDSVLKWAEDESLWAHVIYRDHIAERLVRRFAQSGSRRDFLACATLLKAAPEKQQTARLVAAFESGIQGRSLAGMPEELLAALSAAGGGSLELRVRQGDEAAIRELTERLAGRQSTEEKTLVKLIELLAEVRRPELVGELLRVVESTRSGVARLAALGTLQAYDDASIPAKVLERYAELTPEEQEAAQLLLTTRRESARLFVDAVDAGRIDSESVVPAAIRRVSIHDDQELKAALKKIWGDVPGAPTREMQALVDRAQGIIAEAAGNPYSGRDLFRKSCSKCHVLFGSGGQVGPDLTSYKRDDLARMAVNVVNPSAEIREGFENYLVITDDGRVLNGFLADQDNQVVVLRSVDGRNHVIPRSQIDEMKQLPTSVMPSGLLKDLSDAEIRDLFAYLRASQPLP